MKPLRVLAAIVHPAAIVEGSDSKVVQNCRRYLLSKKNRRVFARYGFKAP